MIKKYLSKIRKRAKAAYEKIILSLIEENPEGRILDLGCNDGEWTLKISGKAKSKNIYGIELLEEPAEKAELKGIKVLKSNLNLDFPFGDNFFDLIHANQVIEHLQDTNHFLSEIKRVLKPNGYCIICTENLSSWHNVFALVMGWQPFSSANMSENKFAIGNPLSLHYQEPTKYPPAWQQHIRTFSWRGLKETFEDHGFKIKSLLGAGYYPLPNIFAKADPKHSAFLIIKVQK